METRDPVRVYLNSVLESRMEVARSRRKIEQLEARALSITSQVTGMPRGGSADRDAVLAALADASEAYYQKMLLAEQRELEVSDFIDSLSEPDHRIILKLRYIDRKRWSKILRTLTDSGMDITERRMFQIHGAALKEARELFYIKEKSYEQT